MDFCLFKSNYIYKFTSKLVINVSNIDKFYQNMIYQN